MELIVPEWSHLALCGKWKCVTYFGKKHWVKENEKVEINQINRSVWICTVGNYTQSVTYTKSIVCLIVRDKKSLDLAVLNIFPFSSTVYLCFGVGDPFKQDIFLPWLWTRVGLKVIYFTLRNTLAEYWPCSSYAPLSKSPQSPDTAPTKKK